MAKIFLLQFVCILVLSLVQNGYNYCLSNDDNPYLLFSTATSYDEVRGDAESLTTCTPIQIWMIVRHGTRHPHERHIRHMKKAIRYQKDIIDHEEQGRIQNICARDLNAIKKWTWDESMESQPELLTPQGWADLKLLAERYKKRYKLLQEPYSSEHYYFRHTWTERTNQSCRAFIEGLFGNSTNNNNIDVEAFEKDDIISPYENCTSWLNEVIFSDDRYQEMIAFRNTDDYQNLILDITNRMGYEDLLTHCDIIAMYNNCRFDKSKNVNKLSPWCSVFTKYQLILMEYYEDLKQFYKFSYGNKMHKKLGCMPFKNLMNTFSDTVVNNGTTIGPKVIVMVTHHEMLDMLYTTMNYAKDEHLLSGTDYEVSIINRKYRTSRNTPFGANVAAVLHDCGPKEKKRFKVQFFINERHMMLPGCHRGLCDWDNLKQYYSGYENCNLDFCDESQ